MKVIDMKDVFSGLAKNPSVEKYRIIFGNYYHYVDRLRRKHRLKELEKSFRRKPKYCKNIPNEYYALFAAYVEGVCNREGIRPPHWVYCKKFYITYKWFPSGLENYPELKESLEEESPDEYRKRNLFVSANALDRIDE